MDFIIQSKLPLFTEHGAAYNAMQWPPAIAATKYSLICERYCFYVVHYCIFTEIVISV